MYLSQKVGLEYTRDFECLSDQPQYIFILLIPTGYKQSHINRSHSIIIYHPWSRTSDTVDWLHLLHVQCWIQKTKWLCIAETASNDPKKTWSFQRFPSWFPHPDILVSHAVCHSWIFAPSPSLLHQVSYTILLFRPGFQGLNWTS